jgi:hypothetical protein
MTIRWNRRGFAASSLALVLTVLVGGCSGSGKPPATRPLTQEELQRVKQEDKKIDDEESTGGSGQKPANKSR